jgi:hypothetical protein
MSVLYSLILDGTPVTLTQSGTLATGREEKQYLRACDALAGRESHIVRLLRQKPSVRRSTEVLVRSCLPDWFDDYRISVSHASIAENWATGLSVTDENEDERYTLDYWHLKFTPRWEFRAKWTNLRS